ncbi:MAG: DNA alkylation repair protein [Prevotella sp.]|nr:DNA alkylation repair protein [Prevotella sp.]
MNSEIKARLQAMGDADYAQFERKIIPTLAPETVVGVRTPGLRAYARQLAKHEHVGDFLASLPHEWFEENQLHAFILSEMKDFPACLQAVNTFLPHVDNWATCDQLTPKVFRTNKAVLLKQVRKWLRSSHEYTVRFAVKMLMDHFLDDPSAEYPSLVASVRRKEYYVKMMQAWYFATALAKQYATVLPFIEQRRLDEWTHNKAIQKALESYRVSEEQKEYLRTLKVKGQSRPCSL